ncbi:hypothetical protein ABIB89_004309 [Bradyrhizobium sp. JR3.12]
MLVRNVARDLDDCPCQLLFRSLASYEQELFEIGCRPLRILTIDNADFVALFAQLDERGFLQGVAVLDKSPLNLAEGRLRLPNARD